MAFAQNGAALALEVRTRLQEGSGRAQAWFQSLGTPAEVCDLYDQVIRDLYWLDKGASHLVPMAQSGLEFCLGHAAQNEKSNPKLSAQFKAQAKTIAYNLAANTWPGWGDDGVSISPSETAIGLEAAFLNLKLALELEKPEDKIAAAYWLVSALQLALGRFDDSLASLSLSDVHAQKAQDPVWVAYNESFRGIILIASGHHEDGQKAFAAGIEALKKASTDSASFIAQLETARRILGKDPLVP